MFNLGLEKLNYKFLKKPILVGGRAKEFYEIRKSGKDTDLIISIVDYEALSKLYPNNLKDLEGDLGVSVYEFEIWRSICLFDYEFYAEKAIEMKDYKIVNLEKLLFMTALAMKKEKYENDLKLIVGKVLELQKKFKV